MIPSRLLKISMIGLSILMGTAFAAFSQTNRQSQSADSARTSLRYPVPMSQPQNLDEALQPAMADLKTPENLRTSVEYDVETGDYVLATYLGETRISTPLTIKQEEYSQYWVQKSNANFFKSKNKIDYSKKKDEFSLTDMQFDLGAAEKIFGPGGVQLRTQGAVEISFGVKNNIVENPSLSERARNRTYFDFDQSIQLSVNGKVGDKINVNMNYDTEASFDYDAKAIKLRYAGKEDEIIKSLEAGNVSMPVKNTLISGGTSLFGAKTELQFGKLNVAAVISQQNSQTTSASMEGGTQTTRFEIPIDAYDENRHFFLSHYFRDHYDQWMSKLPYISSGIVINKIEVWVTNKRARMDNARHIIAFADMAEPQRIFNDHWKQTGIDYPSNQTNTLYNELVSQYAGARQISESTAALAPLEAYGMQMGEDFERLESARLLQPNEYTLNKSLGYISLNQALNPDEILAVAFEYTKNGQVYQVGEFSTDGVEAPQALYVKLLKGTNLEPASPTWDLMMKNVYALGTYNMPEEDFRLNITYQNDTVGTYLNYLTEGKLKNQILLRVFRLDRLNTQDEAFPDGLFDFVNGYTTQGAYGRIIFPVVEPFGAYLRQQIGDDAIADKYAFEELYDSTLTVVQQLSEKNKFRLEGEYRAANAAEISLGAMNVARGSVKVTAGGRLLTENVDYIVDYISGIVTITNNDILSSGASINATCEDQGVYSMVRKTFTGLAMEYAFSDHFVLGGTLMHLSERPLTNKVDMNTEPLNNTLWGLHTAFDVESQALTNLLDLIPLINVTKPSKLNVRAEFAQLVPGSNKQINNTVYVDDFESAKKTVSLKDVTQWHLASTPYDPSGKFMEAAYSNDLRYGYNRSLLAWYYVDPIFTQSRSQTPDHIRSDEEQLSNHYVRAVNQKEIYPDKDLQYNQTGLLNIMNIVYYPRQRGPYNFDVNGMNPDGTLSNPENRWAGMMRKIESNLTNFEANNVEYIEFWLMDPYIYDTLGVHSGGDLYFNLGDISEDVLKDGKKSFENGLPTDGDSLVIGYTKWGKVSSKNVNVYAFDNTEGVRRVQDVGMDGLTDTEEAEYFADYVTAVENRLDAVTKSQFLDDPFSPLNDPAGDNYHYYRGTDYDKRKLPIIDRYKYYNGTHGNSQARVDTEESYETAASTLPDIEDINEDFTLNENERYYQYRVSLRPEDMEVGRNFINDKRVSEVKLKNGKTETVSWYQFKIPVSEYEKRVGNINGFNSIRFIRMYMTGFQDSVVLRMATLELVRGDWRAYDKDLYTDVLPETQATMEVSTVDLEENSSREPIHYVLPPGVEREGDPSQPGVYEENEQSLALKVRHLSPGDARAVYKNTSLDFRQYDRLQMFLHAEAMMDDENPPADYEMTVFVRLGSDYQNNYYEYEIPLKLSPHFVNNEYAIWPEENFLDVPFELLTAVKQRRNINQKNNYTKVYSEYDPENENHKVSIKGNPSISAIKTMMIGVRNNGTTVKSVEIWANEMRLKGFNDDGGWAAQANAQLALSDLGNINFSGRYETDGFGGIEQRVSQRRMDNYGAMNLAMSFNLGRLVPKENLLNLPVSYSVSSQVNTPKYDPLNEDLLLKDVLQAAETQAEKDSIRNYSQTLKNYRSFTVSNAKLNLKSKTPLPIDPANFSFNYSFNETFERDATTEYEVTRNYQAGMSYGYSSPLKAFEPFAKSSAEWLKSPWMKTIKDFSLTYIPNSITFGTNLNRYYYELQNRDLSSVASNVSSIIPLTFSKNFMWNSDFNLNWNLTRNMKFNFTTNNSARVEETLNTPVNKELYPTEYQNWKDTVMTSLLSLGTPMAYQQNLKYTWQIPFKNIPVLDFVTASFQYSSTYKWDRSAMIADVDMGNVIGNQRSISVNPSLNLETLYNKSDFLKAVNKKYASTRSAQSPKRETYASRQKKSKNKEGKMTLLPGKSEFKHNLKNKRVEVHVVDAKGKEVDVKYKVIDENTIQIKSKDSLQVKVVVTPKPSLDDEPWYKALQLSTRLLMSVRNIQVTYQENENFTLPGFKPESSLFFADEQYAHAPGWNFASGLYDPEDFLNSSIKRDWLVMSDSVVSPAVMASTKTLRVKSSVLPIPGLKIDISAQRNESDKRQVQYMIAGRPETRAGNFSMSTIALRTSLAPINAKKSYYSKAFNQFVANRDIIAARLEDQYRHLHYPSSGFLSQSAMAGKPYDAANGAVNKNSADVLIPAFLAAYTGKSAIHSPLDIFPGFLSMLPNWSVSYDGLSKLPAFKKHFKSFSLNHAYNCTYNVSSFGSYNTFVSAGEGNLGFVQDVLSGNPVPSSQFDIAGVSITESFSPLIGAKATLKNGMTMKAEVQTGRTMNLSVTGGQLVESGNQRYVLGGSYKVVDFHPWGILANSKVKNDFSITADFSLKNSTALLRKIEEQYTQATSGNKTCTVEIMGDYVISKNLNFKVFYDLESSIPLVSSYPVTTQNFGVSLRFTLSR